MKKTVLILGLIVVVVYAVFATAASLGEYDAERLYYRARKLHEKIAENPDVAPPAMLASVEKGLKKIIAKHPKGKAAKTTHFTLVEFYITNQEFAQARSMADVTIKKYAQDRPMASKAQFLKGYSYEKENRWDLALREYGILQNKYPHTLLGFRVPLYIGNYYKENEQYAEADGAHREAVRFYEKIENANRGKVVGYAAANLLFQSYVNLRDYEQAGRVLEDILNNYPNLLTYRQQLPKVEVIFVKKLNRPQKAIEIYRSVKEKTDNAELREILEKTIAAMEKEKK